MLQYTRFTYCPRCGQQQLEQHAHNAMRCIACDFLYFHNMAAAVSAIIETKNGIVLVERNTDPCKGMLDLPGGFVNWDESLETALRREIHEELDARIVQMRYFRSFANRYVYHDVTYFTSDAVYICTAEFSAEQHTDTEVGQILIVAPEKIDLDAIAFQSARNALRDYCAVRFLPEQ